MKQLISKKAAKVLDLLEQIESVNDMIKRHHDDPFMREQYQYRKNEFVQVLSVILGEFEISPADLAA